MSSPWSAFVALPPSSETGVYFCLGLAQEQVWARHGVQLRFTQFEAKPGDHPRAGGKFLDALADATYADGHRDHLGVEFKLYSSDLLGDVMKLEAFRPDALICWQHDAPGASEFAAQVIEVGPCMTDVPTELPAIPACELLDAFLGCLQNPHARHATRQLMEDCGLGLWPMRPKGERRVGEVRLTRGRKQVGRLNNYATPRLNIHIHPEHPMAERLPRDGVVRNRESISILLESLSGEQVDIVRELLLEAAR